MFKTKRNKAKCTCETVGTIFKYGSVDGDIKIKVTYEVDGIEYKLQEMVMYEIKPKVIKVGGFPVGKSRNAMLGDIRIGTKVRVLYDPNKPKRAYLPDNDNGHHFNVS